MRKVFLHGNLRDKFHGPFELQCSSVIEAVKILNANFNEFAPTVAQGKYRIIVGSLRKGQHLEEDKLNMIFPERDNIHIIPTISGAKGAGGKIIIGVALLGIAALATGGFGAAGVAPVLFGGQVWGSVAMIGASIALSGIAMMLTPTPKTPDLTQNERPEDRPSFMLGGAVNVVEQGHPIPICGGRNIVGGIVISAGVSIERMP
jgi:predicted phage tail protein